MRWKKEELGNKIWVKKFAFLPTEVNDVVVFLETYYKELEFCLKKLPTNNLEWGTIWCPTGRYRLKEHQENQSNNKVPDKFFKAHG